MMKGETKMDELIQKAGETAERILELEAKELRKIAIRNLNEAQAFAKVYCDPANVDLRRAEREKNGFVRYDVAHEDLPIEISTTRSDEPSSLRKHRSSAKAIPSSRKRKHSPRSTRTQRMPG